MNVYININGNLYSACFLNDNNTIYIIASNNNYPADSEEIKVFDLNGNKIKEISDSKDNTVFIESFYDIKTSKNYIVTGNFGFIKSYDFNENKLYFKYDDNNDKNSFCCSIVINDKEEVLKLVESSTFGNIRIWDFHSGLLLKKIKFNYCLYGISLWNSEYIFVGCEDRTIKLINIRKGINIRNLIGHDNYVITVKKIIHPQYGICLISQSYPSGQIKMWINKGY